MAMGFTPDQQKAIDTRDRSILVSAAAGSGKTAVLIERIINIILNGEANVDEMLIVTFTKAAAAEMRLRLSQSIRKRMHEHPEESRRLKDQLNRLYRAYISTIDSFALRVIREFFYETDIDPDYGTLDDVQGELLKREAIEELFEDCFANDDLIEGCSFREFLRLYSEERSEDGFKDDLLEAYKDLRSMHDYFAWARAKAEGLNVTAETFEGSLLQAAMLADARETYAIALDACNRTRALFDDAGLSKMYEDKLGYETGMIATICEELSEGRLDSELMDIMAGMEFVTLRSTKDVKEAYESIRDEVKSLRDSYKEEVRGWNSRYLAPDFETRVAEMNEAYRYTLYYINLLEEFEKRYEAKKHERRLMDFADMEHNAVRILSAGNAAEVLRKRFKYVFVDEYQDTNNIQEYLIGRVSRPDNVFKVGDIKQSIYRFRQAEPDLFRRLYAKYSDPACADGETIDLSSNFRSNGATINYINCVFERIMQGYDDRAKLYKGLTNCPDEYDFIPEVHILTGEPPEDEAGEELPETEVLKDETDEEIESLSKEEAEAAYIASIAKGLIGTEFYDTKADCIRKASARDIVILFRATKVRGDIMARALRNCGVDAHVEDTDNYFDTVEIEVALALLTCIDNMKRDVPLIASLHSEVFGWTPEELATVRIAHTEHLRQQGGSHGRPAYWEALKWYTSDGPEGALRDKAAHAVEMILEWRKLSHLMPLEDFVWKVLTDSGYYMMAGAMSGGAGRQANLRVLADRAGKYSRETVSSLSSFITFLDVMRQKDIKTGQAGTAGSDDDLIRITTIHKSKGLEYPFVIVGGLGHAFQMDSASKKFTFDSSIGVSMPYIDPARRYWRSTLMQRAIVAKSRRDSFEEELRILYVAMTRARNKLILVGACKDMASLEAYAARPGSFLKVMREVLRTGYNKYYISPLEGSVKDPKRKNIKAIADRLDEPLGPEAAALYDEIDKRFRYKYPHEEMLTARSKYSVSALRREENEAAEEAEKLPDAGPEIPEDTAAAGGDNEVVHLWTLAENQKKSSAADVGIVYHRIMEYLDFARVVLPDDTVDTAYIEDSAAYLVEKGAVDTDAYSYVDLSRISGFFASDLGRRAARASAAGTLRKEKPFTLKTARQGREILVQGVIDCCFEENGSMILIDYKSSFVRPGREHAAELERIRNEYKVQIELYSEAVLKGTGKEVSEAYLYLFKTGEALKM